MADTQQQERTQDEQTKAQFDESFVTQLAGQLTAGQESFQVQTSPGGGIDWAREYYEAVEQQVRSARRIAEAQALISMRQQIVAEVVGQVLSTLQRQGALPTQRRR